MRTWVESDDPTPRARLIAIDHHRDVTAYGLEKIERAFIEMLREIVAQGDPDDSGAVH